jgi:hypothetical protein
MLARDKQSSLSPTFVNYGGKKFCRTDAWSRFFAVVAKDFLLHLSLFLSLSLSLSLRFSISFLRLDTHTHTHTHFLLAQQTLSLFLSFADKDEAASRRRSPPLPAAGSARPAGPGSHWRRGGPPRKSLSWRTGRRKRMRRTQLKKNFLGVESVWIFITTTNWNISLFFRS